MTLRDFIVLKLLFLLKGQEAVFLVAGAVVVYTSFSLEDAEEAVS